MPDAVILAELARLRRTKLRKRLLRYAIVSLMIPVNYWLYSGIIRILTK